MARHNDGGSGASLSSGGSGAPPLRSDFSSFRDMIREEREAARAEREAAAERARVEREAAAAEQWRLMTEAFEQKLQLLEEKGKRSGVAGGEPGTARSCGESSRPVESAAQSSAAVGSGRVTNLDGTDGIDGDRLSVEPTQKKVELVFTVVERVELSEHSSVPAHLLGSEKSRGIGGSGAVPFQQTPRYGVGGSGAVPVQQTQRYGDTENCSPTQRAELGGAVAGSGNNNSTSPRGEAEQHRTPVLLSNECDDKKNGVCFTDESTDTEVCAFQDNNLGTMTHAGSGNNSTSPLPETYCPVLVPGNQAENVAHVDPDESNTSCGEYQTRLGQSISHVRVSFPMRNIISEQFVHDCGGIPAEPSVRLCATANGQEVRVDATVAEAVKGHSSTWGRCVTRVESFGECLAGGDSTVLGSKVLPALPLVVIVAHTVEENHDGKCVNGASETAKVVFLRTQGRAVVGRQGR